MQVVSRSDYEQRRRQASTQRSRPGATVVRSRQSSRARRPQVGQSRSVASRPRPTAVQRVKPPTAQKVKAARKEPSQWLSYREVPKLLKYINPIQDKSPKRRQRAGATLAVLSLLMFASGMYVTYTRALEAEHALEQVALAEAVPDLSSSSTGVVAGESTNISSDPRANEEQPTSYSYSSHVPTSPKAPRYFRAPSIGVEARVLEVGITEDNQIGVPPGIHDVGWYKHSIEPGSGAGAIVLDGHVSGYTTTGIFYKLDELSKGDVVQIEAGTGTVYKYKVVAKEKVDVSKVDSDRINNPYIPRTEGLNLITCGGEFSTDIDGYVERTIVYTQRIK